MIVLFTDFGWKGPYVGQMKAVLSEHAADVPVIDLMHDAPSFNIQASAYLLASLIASFPKGTIFLAVIDPGVGGIRIPCVYKCDDYWFVGPDNGLFNIVLNRAHSVSAWEINWCPDNLSASFHGRDLFAPVAAEIAAGDIASSNKVKKFNVTVNTWPDALNVIIYIDHFGNCMTALNLQSICASAVLRVKDHNVKYARVFSEVKQGDAFWYFNSNGLCEIAVNQGSAQVLFEIKVGDTIDVILND